MRASRLLSILITLQLRGRASARELAERFEVSKRTIYRDVDELSAAGVPIYADRGAGGGFSLLDGWRTQLTGMTADEAEAMLLASLPGAASDLGFGATAATARLKLLAALPGASGARAQRIADRFHLDSALWHRRPEGPPESLRFLAQAVWDSRRVKVSYESWTGRSTSIIEPLGVVLKTGEWYFVAKRRGRPAIHKLANVERLELLDETFDRPERFDLATAWGEAVSAFEASLRRTTARLRVHERALSRLETLGAEIASPLLAAEPVDGWREATVWIESIPHAAGLLLGFGCDVEALSPPELRAELRRRALDVAALYSTSRPLT
jgi:predicted DNA-binding transcriptional regulator YafY